MCLFFLSFTYYSSFYFIYAYNCWKDKLRIYLEIKQTEPDSLLNL